MVRQAAERLDTNNIRNIIMDQLHHFTGQEPSLASLVTLRNNGACHLRQITDICSRMEMTAFRKCLICSLTNPVDCLNTYISKECLGFLKSKIVDLEILIVEAVGHKVDQIRYHRLSSFRFQKLCKVIVCSRKEFNQDLTYNTNTRLLLITDRDGIEIVNHFPAHFLKLAVA